VHVVCPVTFLGTSCICAPLGLPSRAHLERIKRAPRTRKVSPLSFAMGSTIERTALYYTGAVTTREPGSRQAGTSWDEYQQRRYVFAGIHTCEWWDHPWRIIHTRVHIRKQFASPGRVMRARAGPMNDHTTATRNESSSASGNPRGYAYPVPLASLQIVTSKRAVTRARAR
jgi:hypothetical protein